VTDGHAAAPVPLPSDHMAAAPPRSAVRASRTTEMRAYSFYVRRSAGDTKKSAGTDD